MDFEQGWQQSVGAKCLELREKKDESPSLRKNFTYPRICRLKKRQDFQHIARAGSKIFSTSFCLHYISRPSQKTRLGITVTKKFGKAHDRNFFKRSAREAFRHLRLTLPKGIDFNLRPLLPIDKLDKKTLQKEMKKIFCQVRSNGFNELPKKA